jgi:deoxyribonuclease I
MNTEHIVPQSWFGAVEPMKGDLHHLFVCEPECNIARSNFPYEDSFIDMPDLVDKIIFPIN